VAARSDAPCEGERRWRQGAQGGAAAIRACDDSGDVVAVCGVREIG